MPHAPIRLGVLSILPSPYQRDLLAALDGRPDVNLRVEYLEEAAPDSPWPEKEPRPFESILPGFWIPLGVMRFHVNGRIPRFADRDIVIVNGFSSLTAQILVRRHLRGRPWIFWGERLRRQSGPKARVQHWMTAPLRKASAIAAIGSWAKADYEHRFPGVPVENIPYFCDLAEFSSSRGISPERPFTFLFCGQMIERKGIDLLLEAFDRLVAIPGIPEVRLRLIGREADIRSRLVLLPERTRAHVDNLGFQPPESLPGFFQEADVFCLPSRYDGWGVVVNQAIGASLPVLCSDQVGAGFDLVETDVNGIRFEAGNADDLQSAMEKILRLPMARIDAMRRASFERAREWSPEAGAERWVRLLRRCLTPDSEGPPSGKEVTG